MCQSPVIWLLLDITEAKSNFEYALPVIAVYVKLYNNIHYPTGFGGVIISTMF
jgi:hypothetical protein